MTSRARACAVAIALLCLSTLPAAAQTADTESPLERWVEFQNFTLYSRYRFVENSAGVTTANQIQYKDSIRGRFNFDRARRYTINAGYFTGGSFVSTWNNSGIGTGLLNGKDNYFKQLFISAAPVRGVELQYGGLYVNRGELDEFTSFDDDGYLMGERAAVRLPKTLYFDEISATRAEIGPFNQPNIGDRWKGLAHPNYTQALVAKRFNKTFAGSFDYISQMGADTIRFAVTARLTHSPVSTVRYEQYRRVTNRPAAGFAIWADRPVTKYVRLQAGYVTVDQFYGGWNADRMQSGRRLFAFATIPVYGPIAATVYATRAFSSAYAIPLKTRVDVVVSYDVLASLKKIGVF